MLTKRLKGRTLLVVGFLALGGLGAAFLEPGRLFSGAAESAHAATKDRSTVQCLGRLEPGRGVINISTSEGARIDRLHVQEGDAAEAGTILGTTDMCAEFKAEKAHAESQLAEAREQYLTETARGQALIEEAALAVRRVEEVVCHEIQAQKAQVKHSEAQLDEAQRDFTRAKSLRVSGSLSREDYDRYETTQARMTQQVEVGRATLARLQADQRVGLAEAKARLETAKSNLLKAQRAIQIDSLEKRVALIDARLERTMLRAPVSGHVLRIFTWPGERVTTKPLLQMGETGKMYAVAEVYETDVRHIRKGQRATAASPALGQELTGIVEQIGQRIYKNDVLSVDPRAETDSRVVEVRIRLDDPSLARQFVYLQLDVKIDVASPSDRP